MGKRDEEIGEMRSDDRDYWIPLNRWLEKLNISSVTAWRWRKRGWLKVVNVGGRLFVRPQDLVEFENRALAGEFASISNFNKNK
jgi:hypothetical protein